MTEEKTRTRHPSKRILTPRPSMQTHGSDMVNGQAVSSKLAFVAGSRPDEYLNLEQLSPPSTPESPGAVAAPLPNPPFIATPVSTLPGGPTAPILTKPPTAAGDGPLIAASPQPPVASAGPNQVIVLPANTATLDASGSSDPQGGALTFVWSLVSGPNSPQIDNAAASRINVSGLVAGTYIFKVGVFNTMAQESDAQVSVVVSPADNSGATVNTGVTTINSGSTVLATAPLGGGGAGPFGGGGGGGGSSSDSMTAAPAETFWQKTMDFAKKNWWLLAIVAVGTGYLIFSKKSPK